MEYVQQQMGMGRNVPGIVAVLALHVVIGYALVTGLARKVVEVIKAPLETRVIEEVKAPPPELPPPPPPKLAAPPPPFIPPPEINIQQPQVAAAPAIMSVTTTPSPAAAPVAATVQAAPQPAVRRNFAPRDRVAPAYPEKARARGIDGTVLAHIVVQPDGNVAEVRIVSAKPARLFDQEIVRALMQWKFNPEPAGFIGEYEITFKLND